MEYLQYSDKKIDLLIKVSSFKPYYKWNTFNTGDSDIVVFLERTF